MRLLRQLPNLITLLNLFSGCIALIFAFHDNFLYAFGFVALGIFFDFFDGFFARILNASSPLGLQLDSLADMVTSGVTPGLVMYKMLLDTVKSHDLPVWLPYLGFVITLGSCYRLANFNIDTRQTDSFIGLPTPANALFILSLPLVLANTDSLIVLELLVTPWVLLLITALSAYMLNAEIPLFALKIKKFSLKENSLQITFLAICILLLVFFRYAGIPLIILTYVGMSLVTNRLVKK
ncbi:CDP-alcohol phosphatidyltransferase family protein [Flavobacterium sp. MAH-1]|uniref:CDP-alcohol phosphatidyltransferase family protein n=1 Tax=Flavobacterium agri TaxID=2743471 RepID=A0A7Y9C553_9FLAO|nr:CDP-alcohol phosphatidyltransferase family protein [Flavobacterium agri]NUY80912.1 CDP-alcohol phosphatidyltransferase family protein [Flavobacterium agri]NYA70936.1 CDP-alcohol phosphatidyltransferase family protein [Flavobacterium agri]